jgi:hypothetical protein
LCISLNLQTSFHVIWNSNAHIVQTYIGCDQV